MNVLDILAKELSARSHFSLDDKKRYIYLRMCQIFVYDTRYHYLDFLYSPEREKLKAEILDKRINLENVDDFNVCCSSFSYAYKDALKKLLNVDSEVMGNGHRWVELESDGEIIKADGTMGDLTRAKFELETKGYGPAKRSDYYQELLYCRDMKIKYIKFFYENISNLLLNGAKAQEYRGSYECEYGYSTESSDEREQRIYEIITDSIFENLFLPFVLFEKPIAPQANTYEELYLARKPIVDSIFSKYDNIKNNGDLIYYYAIKRIERSFNEISGKISNYEDAKFLLDYMFQSVMFNGSNDIFNRIELFQHNDYDHWCFAPIYHFSFNDRSIYYTLRQEEGHWRFTEIAQEEISFYSRNFKGQNKRLLYRQNA